VLTSLREAVHQMLADRRILLTGFTLFSFSYSFYFTSLPFTSFYFTYFYLFIIHDL